MRCKDCKWFRPKSIVLGSELYGDCDNSCFVDSGLYNNEKKDYYRVYYPEMADGGGFFLVHQDFGCILFEEKENNT